MRWMAALATVAAFGAGVPQQDARLAEPLPNTDMHFRMPVYKTLAEWEARKEHLRKQILSAAGLLPMPEKTPLHAQVFGRVENKDYTVEKVLLETLPGYWLGGNLYRPAGRTGKFPGVVSPHGHWTYGRLENSALGSIPARCINLARQGHVVFAYDMVGYNDTIQTPHAFGGPREQLWAFGPLGLQLWNSIRAVDFVQSLPDVDPERIAATGASGGGTQTFLLQAVDPRVKVSAPVNMISAIMQGGSPCENAPSLRVGTFNVEIGAMMAPRPMLMVSATGDWTRNTPREEFPAIQAIYQLYGAANNAETVQIDAPHNYNQQSREAVYKFFAARLLGAKDVSRYGERSYRPEGPQALLSLHNRSLPAGALTYDQIVAQWITAAKRQHTGADAASLRERLALALSAEWPARVESFSDGERVVLSRERARDRVTGIRLKGSGPVTVVVHPEGANAALNTPEARGNVLLLDVFNGKRDTSVRHFLTFNKTDDAERVQDILTALAWLNQPQTRLVGIGKAGVWCLFAAAVAKAPVTVKADLAGFRGEDQDFIGRFFVPGIQRAGGLEAALKLAKRE